MKVEPLSFPKWKTALSVVAKHLYKGGNICTTLRLFLGDFSYKSFQLLVLLIEHSLVLKYRSRVVDQIGLQIIPTMWNILSWRKAQTHADLKAGVRHWPQKIYLWIFQYVQVCDETSKTWNRKEAEQERHLCYVYTDIQTKLCHLINSYFFLCSGH